MSTTFAELLAVKTAAQWRDVMLARLGAAGFPVANWASGSVPRTVVELFASGLADLQAAVALVAAGGLLDSSTGGWLTLLARGVFVVERKLSTFAEGRISVANGGASPRTVDAGSFYAGVEGAGSVDAVRFVATESVTINPGQTVSVAVKAESPGARFNVGAVTFVFTPQPGLTVSSPALGATGTWLTRAGADEESDEALRQRCRDKWSTLGRGATEAAYRYWCTSAAAGITRVQVTATGDGTVTCYCGGPAGPASAPDVALATASLEAQHPLTDKPAAISSIAVAVVVTGTVTVVAAARASAYAKAVAALAALQADLDIGAELDLGALYVALRQPGVADVDLTSPVADAVAGLGGQIVLNTSDILDPAHWIDA